MILPFKSFSSGYYKHGILGKRMPNICHISGCDRKDFIYIVFYNNIEEIEVTSICNGCYKPNMAISRFMFHFLAKNVKEIEVFLTMNK